MTDNQIPASEVSKPNPVLIMAAIIAALQVILGGSALADFIDPKLIGLFNLILAAVTVGYGVVTRGQVTPWVDVAAKATPNGGIVAGPAANQTTGTPVVITDTLTGNVVAPPPDPNRGDEV